MIGAIALCFGHDNVEVSRTRQEFQDECDINVIMKRYEKTGVITHYSKREPQYVDFSDVPDFHTAMNVMQDAEAAFMTLPASVRKRFENDPQEFVKFASEKRTLIRCVNGSGGARSPRMRLCEWRLSIRPRPRLAISSC